MRACWSIGLMIAGCTGPTDEPEAVLPVPEPTVSIVAPAEAAVITGPLVATVATTDFELRPKEAVALRLPWPGLLGLVTAASAHEAGEAPKGYVAYSVSGTVLAETVETTVTLDLTAFSAGPLVLEAELVWPDGDGFYPAVSDAVSFTWEP